MAAKGRAAIAKLGTGSSARIEIELNDGTRLKGYVSENAEDHLVIVENKTGAATAVSYSQIKKVRGNNLSTGAQIGIAVGVFLLAVGLIFGRLD